MGKGGSSAAPRWHKSSGKDRAGSRPRPQGKGSKDKDVDGRSKDAGIGKDKTGSRRDNGKSKDKDKDGQSKDKGSGKYKAGSGREDKAKSKGKDGDEFHVSVGATSRIASVVRHALGLLCLRLRMSASRATAKQ